MFGAVGLTSQRNPKFMKNDFQRRTLLYVPGSNPKMVAKSAQIDVDAIIFDLEDSVSLSEKDSARESVAAHLKATRETATPVEIIVRINALPTRFAFDDLVSVCQYRPDAIIVPKATVENIGAVDEMICMLEDKHGFDANCIKLIPLLETAAGIEDVGRIVAASKRIVGAQFGAEDFTKEMGIPRRTDSMEIAYARNRMAVACKARAIDCIDTPYTQYTDVVGCEADTKYAKAIGMTGRTLIHPSLIDITRRIFTPTAEEVQEAKEIVLAYEQGIREGKGAFALRGKMIDAPIAERARQVLAKARASA